MGKNARYLGTFTDNISAAQLAERLEEVYGDGVCRLRRTIDGPQLYIDTRLPGWRRALEYGRELLEGWKGLLQD